MSNWEMVMNKPLQYSDLIWHPKTVIFEGKEYPAPLDLLPLMVYRASEKILQGLAKERNLKNANNCTRNS